MTLDDVMAVFYDGWGNRPDRRLQIRAAIEAYAAEQVAPLRQILHRLEWDKIYSYDTGWSTCPVCRGIKPGHGLDEDGNAPLNAGHRTDCALDAAIRKSTT